MRNFDKLITRAATVGLGLAVASGAAFAQGAQDQGTPGQQMPDPVTPNDPMGPSEPSTEPSTEPSSVPPPAVPPPVVIDVEVPPTTTTTTTSTVQTNEYEPVYVPRSNSREPLLERYGIGLVLGGGVEGFTDQTMRDSTQVGGGWDVRAIFGTRQYLGFEAAYIGSAQSINSLGLDQEAILVGNGVQGNLRLNFTKDYLVQPFAYAGAAWRRYDLQNASFNTSAVNEQDDVIEIPMGVGIAYKYRGFLFEGRGEFRAATEEDLMPSLSGNSDAAKMHRVGANLNAGYAF